MRACVRACCVVLCCVVLCCERKDGPAAGLATSSSVAPAMAAASGAFFAAAAHSPNVPSRRPNTIASIPPPGTCAGARGPPPKNDVYRVLYEQTVTDVYHPPHRLWAAFNSTLVSKPLATNANVFVS